jgi:hypothetical protein
MHFEENGILETGQLKEINQKSSNESEQIE